MLRVLRPVVALIHPRPGIRTFLGHSGYSKRLKHKVKDKQAWMKDQKRNTGLRGQRHDSPEVQLSKTVSWLLRHGAKSEKLPMREDGYVRVRDLVSMLQLTDGVEVLTWILASQACQSATSVAKLP